MKTSKGLSIKEILVSGFAMFAIFFGAGNLIFPPALGVMTGEQWFAGFMGYFIMDVVLAVLGVFAIVTYDGELERVPERLGKGVGKVFLIVFVICLGPLVSIPRTGSVSFSMAIKPVLGTADDLPIPLAVFSLVFFLIVLFFANKPGKVVDIVGKYMTPVLLVLLIFTIVMGVIRGTESPGDVYVDSPIKEGIVNGYQTCDGMGSILFAGVLVKTARAKHADDLRTADREIYGSGILAGIILFIVYVGLCYIGTIWGKPFVEAFMCGDIDQAGLLNLIVGSILGWTGVYIIGLITIFACLTTAIGLTTACAQNLCSLFNNRISYKALTFIICGVSLVLANFGLSQILAFANPILNLLYPPIITLIILGLFSGRIQGRITFILGTATAFAVSLMQMLCDTLNVSAFAFVHSLPFDDWNLNFLVPTIIAVAVGLIISTFHQRR